MEKGSGVRGEGTVTACGIMPDYVNEILSRIGPCRRSLKVIVDPGNGVGGAPAGAIAELASSGTGIELVPLAGPQAQALLKSSPWFSTHRIDAGTYKDVPAVDTLAVSAQLVTSAKIPTETVYEINTGGCTAADRTGTGKAVATATKTASSSR